jgi:mRNA deadenylase 3'-5' endonuclease subunit Ccr4
LNRDPVTFSLCSWNILAISYIRPEYYPNTPPASLGTQWRVPALARQAAALGVDILCTQEAEPETFVVIENRLKGLGYSGSLQMKGRRKPDGCATFWRTNRCRLVNEHRKFYSDGAGGPNTGNIAQVLAFEVSGVRLDLVNTHLKWDPPGTPLDRSLGYRQVSQAVAALPPRTPSGIQIICGDLNVTPDSPVVELLSDAGFDYTHRPGPGVFTCNTGREPKLIDYIFFRGPLHAAPVTLPTIDGDTPLPSPEQASDHLPLIANFTLL